MKLHHSNNWIVLLLVGTIVLSVGCSRDLTDDEIPPSQFPDIVLNLSLPSNIALATKGAVKEINDGGVRGIIVYCEDIGVYHA